PIYLRCHRGHDHCFANELARDYSQNMNGREKLIPVRDGDDWGFNCCASANLPYDDGSTCLTCGPLTQTPDASLPICAGAGACSPKCDGIVAESDSFVIGDTPFGLDFIDNQFPAPWSNHAFVATHGAAGSCIGARLVGIAYDPLTGEPATGSNLPGTDAGAMQNFATGWDDGTLSHGRPADVTVSADGRLFISNDANGDILWVAPVR